MKIFGNMMAVCCLSSILVLINSESVFGVCKYCNSYISLNNDKANCFLQSYDDRRRKLDLGNRGWVPVELNCKLEKKSAPKDVAGAITPLPTNDTNIVILDLKQLDCLQAYVTTNIGNFDPESIVRFDEICE